MKKLLIGLLLGCWGFGGVVFGQGITVADTASSKEVKYKYYFAEGLRSKMLGNSDEAIAYFQQCIELLPVSAAAFYEMGLLYNEKKDYSAGTGFARNAWKRDPANKWYGLLLIENLMMQGNHIECVPIYRDLQKIEPGTEDFYTGEIEMLILAKEVKEALKRIDKLPAIGELQRWGLIKSKDIYFSTNQFDKGIKGMVSWVKEYPEDYEIRGILAESYASKGMKKEAADQYKVLKEQNPDNPAVSFSLGQFYYQNGEKDKALEEFLQGFRSPDVNPAIKIEIVKSFVSDQKEENKLSEQVVKLIEVLYLVDKGNPIVDELYANYLYSEERLTEAEPVYRELIKSNPGSFNVWQNLLFILNQKQNFKEILFVSDSAIVYFPGQGLFYLFKGTAAIELKDYKLAILALNKGLSLPGQNTEIIKQFYLSLSEALYRNGDLEDAFKNFDQILALEPDNLVVLNNYSYYLSLENRELDKAKEMSGKCVKAEPQNATYLDTFAWVLYCRGEFEKALEPMSKAIELTTDPTGEVLEHYGDILYRNNKGLEAKQFWEKAKGLKGASDNIDNKIKNGLK
jgi:tetratricopeptide (TPR) repeat protein